MSIKTHGFVGSGIPGSRLYRDYCAMCGGAMRVTKRPLGHMASEGTFAYKAPRGVCLECLGELEALSLRTRGKEDSGGERIVRVFR